MPHFFYNGKMLEGLGVEVPKTWAEAEAVSKAAVDSDVADHGIFLGLAPLEVSLNDPVIRDEAGDLIRSLVIEITLRPREESGVDAVLHLGRSDRSARSQTPPLPMDAEYQRRLAPEDAPQQSVHSRVQAPAHR